MTNQVDIGYPYTIKGKSIVIDGKYDIVDVSGKLPPEIKVLNCRNTKIIKCSNNGLSVIEGYIATQIECANNPNLGMIIATPNIKIEGFFYDGKMLDDPATGVPLGLYKRS